MTVTVAAASSGSSVLAGSGANMELYRRMVRDRPEGTAPFPELNRGILSLMPDILRIIFSYLPTKELIFLKSRCFTLYRDTTDYVADDIVHNELPARTLQIASTFFREPQFQTGNLHFTSSVLERIPAELYGSMTYLDCFDNMRNIRDFCADATRFQALIKINFSLSLCLISPDSFKALQRSHAESNPPLEIVLLGEVADWNKLESVRTIVSPESQAHDFSAIPLHYMKDVRKMTVGDLDDPGDMYNPAVELEWFTTLPAEILGQITLLNLGFLELDSPTLRVFLDLLPNLIALNLLVFKRITQNTLRVLNDKESLKEVCLPILPEVDYGLVRRDLIIHCISLDHDDTTSFSVELMEAAERAFPQRDPDCTNLAPLAPYCQKLRALGFDQTFDQKGLSSLMTLSLEIRNNIKFISIHNPASLSILRQNIFPKLEKIYIGFGVENRVPNAETKALLHEHCPNLREWSWSDARADAVSGTRIYRFERNLKEA